MAKPIDYKTGLSANLTAEGSIPDGTGFIFPENVIKIVAYIMDADLSKFKSVGSSVPLIPGIKS